MVCGTEDRKGQRLQGTGGTEGRLARALESGERSKELNH